MPGALKGRASGADIQVVQRLRSGRQSDHAIGELAEARARIADLETRLANRDAHDTLAGTLLTLRAFRAQLELDVRRAQRYRRPLAVALIDVDGFRSINLDHGYAAGDTVLAAVGAALSEQTRVHDLACRMGGDEFALMLPETGAEDAVAPVERLLVRLEDLEAGPVRGISVSIGLAGLEAKQPPEGLLAAADDALQQARAEGGGRAIVYAGQATARTGHPANSDVVDRAGLGVAGARCLYR